MSTTLADLGGQVTLNRVLFLTCGLAFVKFSPHVYQLFRRWCSPLRNLPGPKNDSLILGHLYTLMQEQTSDIVERWTGKHGKTLRCRGLLGVGSERGYFLYVGLMGVFRHISFAPSICTP